MPIDFPNSPSNGQEHTVGSTTWVYDGSKWNIKTVNAVTNDSMPVGAIMWFGGSSAPTAWLLCDGSAVSRSTYANLFAVVGTTYGSGNGSTTFNLPSISSTTGAYYIRFTTSVGVVSSTALATAPVGTMFDWPTTSSYPTGFLRADGSAVSRTTYADLFTLCSTTYGSGDGSTTFNLPNIAAAGAGSPVKIIKATQSGVIEPSTVAHGASHRLGGGDPVTVETNQVNWPGTGMAVALKTPTELFSTTTTLTGTVNYDAKTQAILYSNTNTTGNWTLNVRGDSSTTFDSLVPSGRSTTVVLIAQNGSPAYYQTAMTIDGVSVTPKWSGGTAPSSGNATANDVYTFTILKTATATYSVFANITKWGA